MFHRDAPVGGIDRYRHRNSRCFVTRSAEQDALFQFVHTDNAFNDSRCSQGMAEYLLEGKTFAPLEMGMLLANAASSLHTDIRHQQLIDREGDQAASPAVFVYTLPNVVSGEICIRHKIQGENTFFITEAYQPEKLERYARIVMQKGKLNYCIIGWCELWKNTYKAVFKLIEKQ